MSHINKLLRSTESEYIALRCNDIIVYKNDFSASDHMNDHMILNSKGNCYRKQNLRNIP